MKQTKTWFYALLLLIGMVITKTSVAQTSCATAYSINPQNVTAVRNGSLTVTWYEFTAPEDTIDLEINSMYGTLINKVEIYSGSCSSLTRIGYDTLSNSTDSVLRIHQDNSLIVNDLYKIKVTTTASIVNYDLIILTVRGIFLMAYDSNQIPFSYCVNQNGVGNNQVICGVTGNCNLTACPTQTLYFKMFLNTNCSCTSGLTNWYFSGLTSNISNLSYLMETINNCPGVNPFVQVVIPSTASGNYAIYGEMLAPCLPCQSSGSQTTSQFSLSVIPNFTTSPIVPASPVCSNMAALVDYGGGGLGTVLTYTYGDSSTGSTPVHTYSSTGTYTVTKLETSGFCSGTPLSSQIQVADLAVSVSLQYVCGININLTKNFACNLSPSGVYFNNTWSIINSSGTTIYSTNSGTNTAINYVFPANGTYTLVLGTLVTTGGGAGTYSNTLTINVSGNVSNPTPIVATASTNSICAGQTVILTASGVNTYTWSPGVNTTSISVSPTVTTTYSVTGTNPCGTNTAVVTITVAPLPTLTVVASPTTMCLGLSSILTASGASTYTWSNGVSSNSISVTPTVTSTYTVTGTSSVGCINTKTISVVVKALPSLTINPSNNSVCANSNFTISASGATTYTWNTGATTSSIVVSSGITKVFTLTATGSNGCSVTSTYNLIVNPLPTLSITASPTIVCHTSSTLSVTGATSYTWNTSATTSSIVVTPTVTTNYTVTGSDLHGCISQSTVSLTYGATAPFVTVTSNTNVICSGSTTLTASGGAVSYTWNPGAITTATIAVSPTVAMVYSISSTYGSGCGTYTSTALVNPVVSTLCCSAASSTLGTSLTSTVNVASGTYTVSGTVIDFKGVVTFTDNTSYSGYTFRMAPGSLLRVYPNKTLTLTNCKLFSCSELWDGIYLINDMNYYCGNIILSNSTIEDMYNGIVMDYNGMSLNASAPSGTISVTGSTLNKNYTSIKVKNSPGYSSGTSPFLLSIVSSTISSYTSSTSPGSTLKPSNTYTYAYNQIINGTTGSSAPYVSFPRSYIGISLNNLGNRSSALVGNNASAGYTNTFDNLDFGINGTEINAVIANNYFKNITGSPKSEDIADGTGFPAAGPDEIGIAVAITQTTATRYNCVIGTNTVLPVSNNPFPLGNKFEDCNKGIQINNSQIVTAKANVFISTSGTDIPLLTTSGPPFYLVTNNPNTYYYNKAQSAIWITATGDLADLSYNYIRNHGAGIYNNFTIVTSGSAQIDISSNDISAPSSTGWCQQAIQVDQVGGTNLGTDKLTIYNNTIEQVYRGIAANSVLSGLLVKQNPRVYVESTTKTYNYSATSNRNGIALNACQYGSVKGNAVGSNASPIPSSTTTAQYLNGIFLSNSKFGKIECNGASSLGRDFVFSGTCNNTWLANSMVNSYTGLEIRTSGVIGPQGANSYTGTPNLSANTWGTLNQQTYAVNSPSVNQTSKLYVQSGATTQPTLNFAAGSGVTSYTNAVGYGINVVTGTSYTCSGGSAQRLLNPPNNGTHKRTAGDADTLALYTALATADENAYDVFPDEFVYHNRQMVYALLKQDSIDAVSGSNLDSFYVETQNTAINQLTQVQQAIAANDINTAMSANASVAASNSVEQKHQRANELVLKYLNDRFYVYTSQEKQDLQNMANECLVKGYYVSQARNIVNLISNKIVNYDDHCDVEADASRKAKPVSDNISSATSFVLFPNPNNGNMQLDYNLGNNNNATMKLYDITGKLINTYKLQNTTGTVLINEQALPNGIYFYHILVGQKTIKTDKIVIIK